MVRNVVITCQKCGCEIAVIKDNILSFTKASVRNEYIICPNCGSPTYRVRDLTGGAIVVIDSEYVTIGQIYVSDNVIKKILKTLDNYKKEGLL